MRIASIENQGAKTLVWQVDGSEWRAITPRGNLGSVTSLRKLIEIWPGLAKEDLQAYSRAVDVLPASYLCPVSNPEKILCVGKNYLDHAEEMGGNQPAIPVIFNKLPSALNGPNQPIRLPQISQNVDYEAELVAVMGRGGKNILRADALSHVFGYTIGNDVTARDWQKCCPAGQWLLGKSFDTFAPVGPWIVTADEITDVGGLRLSLRLNGETMQSASTDQLIFPLDELIAHVSQFVTLRPGDLLFTGTPAGVGAARKPPRFLADGDQIEISIDGIGTLANPVVAEPAS
jgi:2-keto-4-pentenoate hydratase/2-oxohepta-3-ene-1,7-dioic acid hydratase in catechol pathway